MTPFSKSALAHHNRTRILNRKLRGALQSVPDWTELDEAELVKQLTIWWVQVAEPVMDEALDASPLTAAPAHCGPVRVEPATPEFLLLKEIRSKLGGIAANEQDAAHAELWGEALSYVDGLIDRRMKHWG